MSYRNWKLERDADADGWHCLGHPRYRRFLDQYPGRGSHGRTGPDLDECDRRIPPKGLIFTSAKEAGFIAGANIEEFTSADTPEKARVIIQRGWDTYNRLAAVRYPTLALVRGHCMGGGTELALACRYRIAVDEPGTKFALPEVMLGIVPGWGGMLRLPQLVGPAAAWT
jgi:3-hydroxyacyl-CoA dehydrogenase/enoyl-CoA hydratase/3-hydroxybutyryl-CoA epimerase